MARQGRKDADEMLQGVMLPPAHPTTHSITSSNEATPQGSDSGNSIAEQGYFTQHGITAGPNDDFNSMFNRLAVREGLSKSQRKKRRVEAIAGEIDALYGTDVTKLEKWQELCRDVEIEPIPQSITKCRQALSKVYVNLVNLINHRRSRGVKLIVFANYRSFHAYTTGGKRFGDNIFPKKKAKEEGFIKALLRPLHL
ncbi:hypothetical protein N0V94_002195 [Neodidymelliopsis sp. IMI 364377]|nr:hypothetical protein N0V94_002195 [Neodidymelliopsis sp. IMI 364377]